MAKRTSNVSAICGICGGSYILRDLVVSDSDDVKIPLKPKVVLLTWADWIAHIMTHCEECRYCRPPQACQNDFDKKVARRKAHNRLLRQKDDE